MEREEKPRSTKTYMFHYDLIHLPSYMEDSYGDFPVELTEEEFEELVQAHIKWSQPEIQETIHPDADDEHVMFLFCPQIRDKVRIALEKFALKEWDAKIVSELDQADFYIPDEIWDETRKRPEYKQLLKAKKRMQKTSKRRWHLEGKWIKNEVENGKWKGCKIDGVYHGGGMESSYYLEVGRLKYSKYYTLRSHEVRIEIYATEELIREIVSLYSAKYKREIAYEQKENKGWILTYKSNEDNSDIKLFADIFNYTHQEGLVKRK